MPAVMLSDSELTDDGFSQVDRLFSSKFTGLKVREHTVKVLFFLKHLRVRDRTPEEQSEYPLIIIQPLDEFPSDEHPIYTEDVEVIGNEGGSVSFQKPAVWFRFSYQVTVASKMWKEFRTLQPMILNVFPLIRGGRFITIGETNREVRLRSHVRDHFFDDRVFRSNFIFDMFLPVVCTETTGEVPTIQFVDFNFDVDTNQPGFEDTLQVQVVS